MSSPRPKSRSASARITSARVAVAAALLAAAGAGAPALACNRESGRRSAARHHLVLISIDTLRRDALGCHGAPADASPFLDALAKESVVFDQAIAASNYTGPSHATMLTGVSPRVHGVLNTVTSTPRSIPAGLPTLAERLKDVGFATWGDTARGYVSSAFGFQRGFEAWREEPTRLDEKAPRLLDWLAALPDGKLGFGFLHTYEVHAPYLPNADELDRVLAKHPASVIPDRFREIQRAVDLVAQGHMLLFRNDEKFTDADVACLRDLYAAVVRRADASIGALVDGLRTRGLLDKTILVVTSDHGEEFHDHGALLQHENVFDTVVRVPLLVRLPNGASGGTRVASSFPSVALVPTLLDLLGLPAPGGIEGKSLAGAIGKAQGDGPVAFAVQYAGEKWMRTAIRSPRAKLFKPGPALPGGREIYFDLVADPGERKAVAIHDVPAAHGLLKDWGVARNLWEALTARVGEAQESEALSEETAKQLEALGYVK